MILDLLFVAMLFGAGILGFRQGLVVQLFSLLSWIVALWMAYEWTDDLAPLVKDWLFKEEGWFSFVSIDQLVASLIAFFILFFVVRFLLRLIQPLLGVIGKLPIILQLNQLGGLFFSIVKSLILMIIIVNILHLLPWESGQQTIENSYLAQQILAITPQLTQELKELFIGSSI
jgi:membrane protein required for colicin V production